MSRDVPGVENGSINVGVHQWPSTDVYWLPSDNLINNRYMCSKTPKCFYTCDRITNMMKHEKNCTDVQKILSQQLQYGSQSDQVTKVSEIIDLDLVPFRQRHFCCYDIETFGKNDVCVVVSIAVASTLDDPRYFEKSDDTPEAGYKMICDFIDYLFELQELLLENLEPEIQRAISFLQSEKEGIFNQQRYHSKPEFYKLYNYYRNYEVLKVFGFNSRFVQFLQFWYNFLQFLQFFFTIFTINEFSANLTLLYYSQQSFVTVKSMSFKQLCFKKMANVPT